MAKEVYEWALTNPGNGLISPVDGGMPEGMPRSSVNDAGRERMRAQRQLYDTGMEWLNLMRSTVDQTAFVVQQLSSTEIRIVSGTDDMSSYFSTTRRLRVQTAGAPPTNVTDLFVASVVYSNPNTDVTIDTTTGDTVPAGIDEIFLLSITTLGKLAFKDTIPSNFVTPAGFTDTNFSDALALIDANGGGILLLDIGTYAITTTHTIDFPIIIMGQGQGASILRQGNAADLDAMLEFVDPALSCAIYDVGFNGNRSNQTAGDGDGIWIHDGAQQITLRDCFIENTRGHGIRIDNEFLAALRIDSIWIEDCVLLNVGRDGIHMDDARNSMLDIFLSGVLIQAPGQLAGVTDSYGILSAGSSVMSNIAVSALDLNSPSVQRGIGIEQQSGGGVADGRRTSINGFTIIGIGQDARGVEMSGRQSEISNGNIQLTGSVSRGIIIGGDGTTETPIQNVVTGVTLLKCNVGVLAESRADGVLLDGVYVRNCDNGMILQGDNVDVSGCVLDASVSGEMLTGIAVQSGASHTYIHGTTVRNATTASFDVQSGALDTIVSENHHSTNFGAVPLADAGTRTHVHRIHGVLDAVEGLPVQDLLSGITTVFGDKQPLTGWGPGPAIPSDSMDANGDNYYMFTCMAGVTASTNPSADITKATLRFYYGPNGDDTDPEIALDFTVSTDSGVSSQLKFRVEMLAIKIRHVHGSKVSIYKEWLALSGTDTTFHIESNLAAPFSTNYMLNVPRIARLYNETV